MLTENVILDIELKKKLQHLSIDIDRYISTMLIEGAEYILYNDVEVSNAPVNTEYVQFTMKIDDDFKQEIKTFCVKNKLKIKDFWNEAAKVILASQGVLQC